MIAATERIGESVELVEWLIDQRADLSIKDNDGNTVLISAVAKGRLAVVTTLLDRGQANIHDKNNEGESALTMAVLKTAHSPGALDVRPERRQELVEALLERGADIRDKNNDEFTALIHAAYWGYEGAVELLLNRGADVRAQTNARHGSATALTLAAVWGHREVVRILLDRRSAEVDKETVLILAAEWSKRDVVELLLDRGADITARDGQGRTALLAAIPQACVLGGELGVVQLLLDRGGDIHAKDSDDNTALILATSNHNDKALIHSSPSPPLIAQPVIPTLTRLLLEHGSLTPPAAVLALTKLLLERGADVLAKNKDGDTALIKAAAGKRMRGVVELLLDRGAALNAKNNAGHTALIAAAAGGHQDTVELLVARGADVLARNNEGKTAEEAAAEGHVDIKGLLRVRRRGKGGVQVEDMPRVYDWLIGPT
jgi:ankyrin repeat protein